MMNLKPKSPVNIKNAFGNFIPARVEVKMAYSSVQTSINGSGSVNSNNGANSNSNRNRTTNSNSGSNINNVNNLATAVPLILQRNASQPIDIAPSANNDCFQKPNAPTVAQQLAFNKMDKKKANRSRFDKNKTFSTPVDDPVMEEEFDFEKNLALFDKQAIWDKIDANQMQKPDLVCILYRIENGIVKN